MSIPCSCRQLGYYHPMQYWEVWLWSTLTHSPFLNFRICHWEQHKQYRIFHILFWCSSVSNMAAEQKEQTVKWCSAVNGCILSDCIFSALFLTYSYFPSVWPSISHPVPPFPISCFCQFHDWPIFIFFCFGQDFSFPFFQDFSCSVLILNGNHCIYHSLFPSQE